MKTRIVLLILAAALGGCATPYAVPDFDFTGVDMSAGLRERELRALEENFVHSINPEEEFRL
jgi:hypothetical protein